HWDVLFITSDAPDSTDDKSRNQWPKIETMAASRASVHPLVRPSRISCHCAQSFQVQVDLLAGGHPWYRRGHIVFGQNPAQGLAMIRRSTNLCFPFGVIGALGFHRD